MGGGCFNEKEVLGFQSATAYSLVALLAFLQLVLSHPLVKLKISCPQVGSGLNSLNRPAKYAIQSPRRNGQTYGI